MTQADGSNCENEARRANVDNVPPMPKGRWTVDKMAYIIPVAFDGVSNHGIGYKYQPARKGGAIFIVFQRAWFADKIVSERHPATEIGWRAVWREFVAINPKVADKTREELYRREEAKRKEPRHALEQSTLALVPGAIFLGGYAPRVDLAENSSYDLRFLEKNLGIFSPHGTETRGEFPYSSFSDVQIGGPGLVKSVSLLSHRQRKLQERPFDPLNLILMGIY